MDFFGEDHNTFRIEIAHYVSIEIIFQSSMAFSHFNNLAQLKSYRIVTFSQLFSSLNSHSNSITCLPRKLRPKSSRSLHLSVYRNKNSSSSFSSLCQLSLSVERNLCYLYSQRRYVFDAENPEPESEGDQAQDSTSCDKQWPFGSFFLCLLRAFQPRKVNFYDLHTLRLLCYRNWWIS